VKGSQRYSARAQLSRASRHLATPSLGQDAALSFVVICRGQEIEVRGKKKQWLLWERLFRPELACPEPVEGSKGSRDWNDFNGF